MRLTTTQNGLRARILLVLSVLAAFAVVGAGQSAARASTSSGTQTVQVTIDVPALPLENRCNGDVVNLHGQETITTQTTPTSDGGVKVLSTVQAHNLTGSRIAPPPVIGYRGDDTQDTYSYQAPPPYPTTVAFLHWTKLIPEGQAPVMWLVLETREVIAADGAAVPTVDKAYLTCAPPTGRGYQS